MPVTVQTPVYDGPFDLLLHLILRDEVDLYEVSLASIVDAYLAELARMDGLDLEITTEFLLIASILVELKTKRLLPDDPDLDLDDEFGLWEQRDLLLSRLVECKTFKDASAVFAALHAAADRSFARTVGPDERFAEVAPDPFAGVTGDDLRAAYFRAIRPKPVPTFSLAHVTLVTASVTDAIAELTDRLSRTGRASFRSVTEHLVDKVEIVVRFLAMLELYKQGLVELDQTATFGEIEMVWTGGEAGGARFAAALVDAYDG